MRRLIVLLAAIAASVVFVPSIASSQDDPGQSGPVVAAAPVSPPSVVSSHTITPRLAHRVLVRFTPWAHPTPAQVYRIISVEAAGNAYVKQKLINRIRCESGFQWNNSYTGHLGLLQFLQETFDRGVSTLRSRRVVIPLGRRLEWRHRVTFTRYSDGRLVRSVGRRVRVLRVYLGVGLLPKHPDIWHGWTQVRIGAEAIRGQSAVSDGEWSCRG